MLRRLDLLVIGNMQVLNDLDSTAWWLLYSSLLSRHVSNLNRVLDVLIEAVASLRPELILVVVYVPRCASACCFCGAAEVIPLDLARI